MNNGVFYTTFITTWIVLLIGIITISIATHEFTHYYDLKDKTEVIDICIFNIPMSTLSTNHAGSISHLPCNIESTLEIKASLVQTAVFFLLFFCAEPLMRTILLNRRKKNE